MNVGDKFILHSENGRDYTIKIVNVNEYREPSLRYAADVWDDEGNHPEDVMFFGDEFLEKNKSKIEKIGGVHHTGGRKERGRMTDKTYCTECPYFKYTNKDSDYWYGTKCGKDNHEAQPSMYAIKSLHDRCPLTSSNTREPASE